jgi:hypothetical protein
MAVTLTLNVTIITDDEDRASASVTVGDAHRPCDAEGVTAALSDLVEKPIGLGSSVLAPGLSMRSS